MLDLIIFGQCVVAAVNVFHISGRNRTIYKLLSAIRLTTTCAGVSAASTVAAAAVAQKHNVPSCNAVIGFDAFLTRRASARRDSNRFIQPVFNVHN